MISGVSPSGGTVHSPSFKDQGVSDAFVPNLVVDKRSNDRLLMKEFRQFFCAHFPDAYDEQKQQLKTVSSLKLKHTVSKILLSLSNRDLFNLEKKSISENKPDIFTNILKMVGLQKQADQALGWRCEYQTNLILEKISKKLAQLGYWDIALDLQPCISNDYQKAETVIQILRMLNSEKAKDVVLALPGEWLRSAHLKEIAKDLKDFQCVTLELVIHQLVLGDHLKRALNVLELLPEKRQKCAAISYFANTKCIAIIDRMANEDIKTEVFANLALSLVRKKEIDQAIEVGNKIQNENFKSLFLHALSKFYADNNEMDKAIESAKAIVNEPLNASAFMYIVMNFVEKENLDIALKWMEMIPIAYSQNSINTTVRWNRNNRAVLLRFAKALVDKDSLDQAGWMIYKLDKESQSEGYLYLYHAWIKSGNLNKAIAICEMLLNEELKRDLFIAETKRFIEKEEIDDSIAFAQALKNDRVKGTCLLMIIKDQIAKDALDKVINLPEGITNTFQQSTAIRSIVIKLMHRGERERAEKLIDRIPDQLIKKNVLEEFKRSQ